MKRLSTLVILVAVLIGAAAMAGCYGVTARDQGAQSAPAAVNPAGATLVQSPTSTPVPDSINISTGNELITVSPATPGGAPAMLPGGAGVSQPENPIAGQPPTPGGKGGTVNWLTFRDDTFRFEILYPPSYVVLKPTVKKDPQPVREIHFQDKDLAKSETANLELPQFMIEVFDNSAKAPLDQWLRNHKLTDARSTVSAYSVGGMNGVHVTSMLLLAPNEFFYLAQGTTILRLTPLGEFSNQMLASLKAVK